MKASINNLMFIAKIAFVFVLFNFLAACSDNNKNTTIRVSFLPDTSINQLDKRYNALIDYVSKQTGLHFELIYAKSYQDLYDKFLNKEIDLANFGGITYIKAHSNAKAEPLIFRDVDERFYSVVIVKNNHPAKTLSDLKNTHFSFGAKLSTSGHFMPRYFFSQLNMEPETFFKKVTYSGSHYDTAKLVAEGKVSAGSANAEIINKLLRDGRVDKNSIRVLWTSPPYPDYVWAVQPHIPDNVKNKIREAFLSLSLNNPEHSKILNDVGAKYFLPATHENFVILEDIYNKSKMLK